MSWDDEDFDVPSTGKEATLVDDWEQDGSDNDEPLLDGDDWDVDEDEVKKRKEEEAKKKKLEEEKKKAAKALAAAKKNPPSKLADIDKLDPAKRKQLLKEAELEADLNNAADLFGGLGVADEHPRAKQLAKEQELAAIAAANKTLTADSPITDHPIFEPETKQDFVKLRKALVPVFEGLAEKSLTNYSTSLTIDLIRDISKPMSVENIRKVISTLNIVVRDKEKAERQARLAKVNGGAGLGKKKVKGKVNLGGGFKKEDYTDTTNYDDFDDDDDFM